MSITTDTPPADTVTLDDVRQLENHAVATVAAIRAEYDEIVRGLKAAIALVAEECDQAKAHAARAWAAAEDIANAVMNVMCENGRLRDSNTALARENEEFRAEIAGLEELRRETERLAPGRHRFRRGR